jgi:hypothetical protein
MKVRGGKIRIKKGKKLNEIIKKEIKRNTLDSSPTFESLFPRHDDNIRHRCD